MSTVVKNISSVENLGEINLNSSVVASKDSVRNFGYPEDVLEFHIYTPSNDILISDYNYKGYKLPDDVKPGDIITTNKILLDPVSDIQKFNFSYGKYIVNYNILRRKIINSENKSFIIKQISSDRTEIRLYSNLISDGDLESSVLQFLYEFDTSLFYKEFLLDFGNNEFSSAVNIALDKNNSPFTVLIKLYTQLPEKYSVGDSLWIVESLSVPYRYEVDTFPDREEIKPLKLKVPNFDINVKDHLIKSSDYYNIDNLYKFNSLSSYRELLNKLKNNNVQINIDYTDFTNFIHYSSAVERLNNFKYKLSLIENYQNDLTSLSNIIGYTSSLNVSSSVQTINGNINDLIKSFDGYESYLYYESSSFSWPKSGSQKPYVLYNTTSSQALTWFGSYDNNSSYFGGSISTASVYDIENMDNLVYSAPQFIRNDDNNESYLLFLNMVGQEFDNMWIYAKGISDLHKANNDLNKGISKDLVFYVLRSLGIKLYNSESDTNIFEYFLGSDSNGNNNPMSSSYSNIITASSAALAGNVRHKEILKRIYHNVPFLLKSKGTNRGIKALITSFGIPSTILDVIEYGGSDKSTSTIEYDYERFTYALRTTGSYAIQIPWSPLTQNTLKIGLFNIVGDAIEFRFKPDKNVTNLTQSLFNVNKGSNSLFGVKLQYTSSNGYSYGNINLILSGSQGYLSSSTISLPIFVTQSDGETSWWNILVERRFPNVPTNLVSASQYYDIYVKNEIGGQIGHQGSASLFVSESVSGSYNYSWMDYGTTSSFNFLYLGGSGSNSVFGNNFQGLLQEFRIWSNYISESSFNFHVLNPESYQGDLSGSAYNDLAVRFTLGNNLITYNHSLTSSVQSTHPNQNISFTSGSFFGGSLYGFSVYGVNIYGGSDGSGSIIINSNSASLFGFNNENNYRSFVETYYANVPNSVYSNPVTQKIRIHDNYITGSVLKHDLRLESKTGSFLSNDLNTIDVSLSPQNEVNKDIIGQFGDTFNIDNLIGNPADLYNGRYNSLELLKNEYFVKYISKYNFKDYIRLIDFFNNSLFKMIGDFVPMRSSLNTGITIKPIILERSKVKMKKPSVTYDDFTGSIGHARVRDDRYNISNVGDLRDQYTGENSGSIIDVNDLFQSGNYNRFIFEENITNFDHSDFNVLLNNVSQSRHSNIFRTLDINNSSITYRSELQDSYVDYKRHSRPRHDGSKSTSLKYNVYTPATESYKGDDSYDKNAAIDLYSRKFAFFSEVVLSGSTLPSRSNAYIKYLIDEFGSVTELTQQNKNLFEIQNTYKTLTDVDVSLFDNQNPTNQKSLDGVKLIYAGGYRYSPLLFNDLDNPSGSLIFDSSDTTTYKYTGRGGFGAGAFGSIFNISGSGQVGQLDYRYDYTGSNNQPVFIYFNEDPGFYTGSVNTYNVPVNGTYDISVFYTFRASGSYINSGFIGGPKILRDGTAYMGLQLNVNGTNYVSQDYVAGNNTNFTKPSGSCNISLSGIALTAGSKISASVFVNSFYKPANSFPNFYSFGVQYDQPGVFGAVDPNRTTFIVTSAVTSSASGSFIVDPTDRRYVSCSQFLSRGYGNIKFMGYNPNKYDDVEYSFTLEQGDLIRFATGSMITNDLEFEISEVILPIDNSPTSNDRVIFRLSNYVPTNVNTDFFVVVKKIPDETNVVIRFSKRYGQTSAGLLLPGNLAPDVKANVANIVSPLKDKLLSKVLIIGR